MCIRFSNPTWLLCGLAWVGHVSRRDEIETRATVHSCTVSRCVRSSGWGVRDHTWRLLINKRYLQQQHRESTVERSLLGRRHVHIGANARNGRYTRSVYGQAQRDAAYETKRDGLRKIQGVPCFSRHVPCYFSQRTHRTSTTTIAAIVVSWPRQHWPNGLYLP